MYRLEIKQSMSLKGCHETSVSPSDILGGIKTFAKGPGFYCSSLDEKWTLPEDYIAWAKQGLKQGGDKGLSDAVTYAKRSVCRTIDSLLRRHFMTVFLGRQYPDRIDALVKVGLTVPEIIHDLVIDPRNQIEHDYRIPTLKEAKHAVELAELLLRSLEHDIGVYPPVLVWPELQSLQSYSPAQGHYFEITGFGSHPILFVDLFQDEQSVKIIDIESNEIQSASLSRFQSADSIELAKLLRTQYSHGGYPREFFDLFKATLGL